MFWTLLYIIWLAGLCSCIYVLQVRTLMVMHQSVLQVIIISLESVLQV